jgi:hypothetical protein
VPTVKQDPPNNDRAATYGKHDRPPAQARSPRRPERSPRRLHSAGHNRPTSPTYHPRSPARSAPGSPSHRVESGRIYKSYLPPQGPIINPPWRSYLDDRPSRPSPYETKTVDQIVADCLKPHPLIVAQQAAAAAEITTRRGSVNRQSGPPRRRRSYDHYSPTAKHPSSIHHAQPPPAPRPAQREAVLRIKGAYDRQTAFRLEREAKFRDIELTGDDKEYLVDVLTVYDQAYCELYSKLGNQYEAAEFARREVAAFNRRTGHATDWLFYALPLTREEKRRGMRAVMEELKIEEEKRKEQARKDSLQPDPSDAKPSVDECEVEQGNNSREPVNSAQNLRKPSSGITEMNRAQSQPKLGQKRPRGADDEADTGPSKRSKISITTTISQPRKITRRTHPAQLSRVVEDPFDSPSDAPPSPDIKSSSTEPVPPPHRPARIPLAVAHREHKPGTAIVTNKGRRAGVTKDTDKTPQRDIGASDDPSAESPADNALSSDIRMSDTESVPSTKRPVKRHVAQKDNVKPGTAIVVTKAQRAAAAKKTDKKRDTGVKKRSQRGNEARSATSRRMQKAHTPDTESTDSEQDDAFDDDDDDFIVPDENEYVPKRRAALNKQAASKVVAGLR